MAHFQKEFDAFFAEVIAGGSVVEFPLRDGARSVHAMRLTLCNLLQLLPNGSVVRIIKRDAESGEEIIFTANNQH